MQYNIFVPDHFDYVRNLIGPDHLGVGADYDGSEYVCVWARLVNNTFNDAVRAC